LKRFKHDDEDGRGFYRIDNLNTYSQATLERLKTENKLIYPKKTGSNYGYKRYLTETKGVVLDDVWEDIFPINSQASERLGYPTQKPEELLERIIAASSGEGSTILDAYCGCGTTVAVANRLNRKWIGIDITYQSVSLVLKRLAETNRKAAQPQPIVIHGIPKDLEAVDALIHKKDDRVRKEYEKWAVLTFTENRGMIREKKGADGGIDGTAYIGVGKDKFEPLIISVKSGKIGVSEMRDLRGVVEREKAIGGVLITRQEPSKAMISEAKSAGQVKNDYLPPFDRLQIVTAQQLIEGKRLQLPTMAEVVKKAVSKGRQEVYQRGLSF
jgi:site-specific DNA-methyltransferase (adenine-specific)